MGASTWTGPIKAGNVLNTTGTTVGSLSNVGYVIMSQSAPVAQATNVAVAGLYKTNIVIPARSQILRIDLFKTVVWNGVATTINVGTSATATELAIASENTASTTLGFTAIAPGNDATRTGKWIDVGTSDVQIYMLSTNTGTGVGTMTVHYVQARDLTA